ALWLTFCQMKINLPSVIALVCDDQRLVVSNIKSGHVKLIPFLLFSVPGAIYLHTRRDSYYPIPCLKVCPGFCGILQFVCCNRWSAILPECLFVQAFVKYDFWFIRSYEGGIQRF